MKTNSTAEDLIKRSINSKDVDDALDACNTFTENFEDDPRFFDIQITYSILRTYLYNQMLNSGSFPELKSADPHEGNKLRKELFAGKLPPVLVNGLVIDSKISDKVKRDSILNFIKMFRNTAANELYKIFKKAEKETQSLLVDGDLRGNIEKKSKQDVYSDAEIYYNAYVENDLEGAFKGFSYLKTLNPYDSYFRLALGAVLSDKGENTAAIQEFLYGLFLDPGSPKVTANLMNALSLLDLHFLVIDIWINYKTYGKPELDEAADRDIDQIANISKACIIGLISYMSEGKLTVGDVSENAIPLFDEMEPILRPWFDD
jgi:hypothetical protein